MRKFLELKDPGSCLSKADRDEMIFVLLGRDSDAPDTIRFWVQRRIESGKNKPGDPKILDALHCAEIMEAEQDKEKL